MQIFEKILFLSVLGTFVLSQTQDDPQEIAEVACESATSVYEFNTNEGYIESLGYPNDEYGDEVECEWYINPSDGIPEGQEIYLEIEHFDTQACCDQIDIYHGQGTDGEVWYSLSGSYSNGSFFVLGEEPVTLRFEPDDELHYSGFRMRFYVGESSPAQTITEIACDAETMPAVLLNDTEILETPYYPSDHPSDVICQWIITPENYENGIFLNVLYFDTFQNYLWIYFDDNFDGDSDAYWYGSYHPGYSLYTSGRSLALYYTGYDMEEGFQLVYYPADAACLSGSGSIVEVDGKAELKSPGYPYDVPEHLSCRWFLLAPEGQRVMLKSLNMDLYGDGTNCEDEYVEILDGDSVNAISLGHFCGNMTFGSIPSSTSTFQVYLRTQANDLYESRTGFRFEYESY